MAILVVLFNGCAKSPTAPEAVLATETFTGTVQVGGADAKTFTVAYAQSASDASVTVTSLATAEGSTPVAATIGVGFGTIAADGSCARNTGYTATAATIGQELVASSAFGPGSFCVQVFDAGTLTEATTYGLLVKHY
jgi:hypothetical protein